MVRRNLGQVLLPNPPRIEFRDMTVLVAGGSSKGIALAADGRRIDFFGNLVTDRAQKIWHNVSNGCDLAEGWAGSTEIVAGETFSFPRTARRLWAETPVNNLSEVFYVFASKMCKELQTFLDVYVNPYPSFVSTSQMQAKTLIGVFLGEKPILAALQFFVRDGRAEFLGPQVDTLIGGFCGFGAGSNVLWTKYAMSPELPDNLPDAITHIHEYVSECIKNRELISDCSEFGGHLHIAVIDEGGFRWEIPPAQLSVL